MKNHQYQIKVAWTGNDGNGTQNYTSYRRDHTIYGEGKYTEIQASSDPSFLGDPSKYNPEDLFLSSIAACHMLWYLHLCSVHKIVVTEYTDLAKGTMVELENGSGRFTSVTLHPKVTITDTHQIAKANALHKEAHNMCFIANSCNFNIDHVPETIAN